MANKHKVLVIAPSWVGDMVMSQTLFKLLKQQYGDSLVLDVFASSWARDVLMRMPEVSQVITNPFVHGQLALFTRIKLGLKLRGAKYEQVFVLPNSFKSAIMTFFSGIKQRTGFVGEGRYFLLNDTYRLNRGLLPLMVDRFCALANKGSKPSDIPYPLLSIDRANAQKLVKKFAIDVEKPLVAFCPAAEYGVSKRWSPKYFAKLADMLARDGYQIILFGSAKDAEICQDIISQATANNIVDVSGKTTLTDVVDLFSLVRYVVSNDSGLMHIACAVGSNVIAIYGSSSPGFTPPLSSSATILWQQLDCSPCFARTCRFGHYNCLNFITPDIVYQKICHA